MILVDAYEREKNLESLTKEMNLESLTKEMNQKDLLLGLQAYARFRSWDLLRFCYALRSVTGTHRYPSFRIWTCKFRVLRMQPNEYIRMPSDVHKSKYT